MSGGIFGSGLKWDFIQDAKPANPDQDGITWLRTTDYTGFVYAESPNRWVALGNPGEYSTSGANNIASGSANGRFHAIVQNATGKVWRPYHDLVIVGIFCSANNVPDSSHTVGLRVGSSFRASIQWDGVNNYNSSTANAEVDQEEACNMFFSYSSGTGANRWSCGVWWKLRVDGD